MTRRSLRARARAWLSIAVIAIALFPWQAAAAAGDGRVYGTSGEGVWLRAAPAPDAPKLVVLPEGAPLILLEGPKRGNGELYWARVDASGTVGWMIAEYLLMNGSPPPVNTTPPPTASTPPAAPNQITPDGWAQVVNTFGTDGLRLRSGPAPWETLLAILPEGSQLQVLEGPVPGGNSDPWYRVTASGQTGWVDGIYLTPVAAPAPNPTPPTSAAPGTLPPGAWAEVIDTFGTPGLRLRSGPAPWEALLATLPEGSKLQIVEGPVTGGNGDPWYRVNAAGTTGWVDGIYLTAASGGPGTTPLAGPPPPNAAAAAELVRVALAQVGKRYVWGGAGPDTFDCSGLVVYAAQVALGIALPRVAADQAFAGVHVDASQLAPGDLVFFANTYQPGISHVGIYLGAGRWVTAEDEQTGVVVRTLDMPYWKARYAGARRIV